MNPISESEILSKLGMMRLWIVEMGWMHQMSTAIALQTLELEVRRNCAIVGDGSQGAAENSSNDVISSSGLNLTNIGPMKAQD
jgi:hypothetical protein